MSSTTKAYSITIAGAKKGGRRWSPSGGYNPPPHRRWCRVLDHKLNVGPLPQMPNLKCRPSSHPPLYNSLPGRGGTTGIQLQICAFCGLGRFFGEFLPLGNVLQKLHRKNIEKNAKIEDFGLPKTLPKPSQNPSKIDVPKNMQFL